MTFSHTLKGIMNRQSNFYGRQHENTTLTPNVELLGIKEELTALKDMLSQLAAKVEEVWQQQSDVYQRLSGVEILGEDLLSKHEDVTGRLDQLAELRSSNSSHKERLPRALSVRTICL